MSTVDAAYVRDQYADGKAAKVWELYTGAKQTRTTAYRKWICDKLRAHNVVNVLDVACGTGVDSVMLLEEGFNVVSLDLSDKMLKYALQERWERRKETAFDRWVIVEGNWLSLCNDIEGLDGVPANGFDAVVCLGNSFAHLPDITGGQRCHYQAIRNMASCLKKGGLLIIDHRNYDAIIDTGRAPQGKNIYYPSDHIIGIETTTAFTDGQPSSIQLNYKMDVTTLLRQEQLEKIKKLSKEDQEALKTVKFSLSYYPHRLTKFQSMLKDCIGQNCNLESYGDFKPITKEFCPAYYIHVAQRTGTLNGYHVTHPTN